jgi:hypothetical protein
VGDDAREVAGLASKVQISVAAAWVLLWCTGCDDNRSEA